MSRKLYTPEQIIGKLREAEVVLSALDLGLENLKGLFRYEDHTFNLLDSIGNNDNGKLRAPSPGRSTG